jgi:thioredoxin reductase (NADPH)
MPKTAPPLIEARHDQMFPVLERAEIARLARFGERKLYAAGERIVATGEIAPGAFIILSGRVDVSQRELGHSEAIVTHGPGSFMGELAQLSGRPALVDARAIEAVETLVIPPQRLLPSRWPAVCFPIWRLRLAGSVGRRHRLPIRRTRYREPHPGLPTNWDRG